MKKALIVVDVQNDFCPGGSLAVAGGDDIIPVINSISGEFDALYFTLDYHSINHCSFVGNGGEWPEHCVAGTRGAQFHDSLLRCQPGATYISKGAYPDIDSYSAFWDNEKKYQTPLADALRHGGIMDVYICGLATDYCVKFTAMDAIGEGFSTTVILNACRGVDPKTTTLAITEMKAAGVKIIDGVV